MSRERTVIWGCPLISFPFGGGRWVAGTARCSLPRPLFPTGSDSGQGSHKLPNMLAVQKQQLSPEHHDHIRACLLQTTRGGAAGDSAAGSDTWLFPKAMSS